jgi:hypothetical protein
MALTDTWIADTASWIWLPGDERPDNAYVQFRKVFELASVPNNAVIRVSADCKYLLSVNGEVVGRGPITTDPKHKQVDAYGVSPFLHSGMNVITVLVLQRHAKTSRLWPVRGGFLLQLDNSSMRLGTDSSWKARWATEYRSDTPFMTHQYGNQEWLNGRLAPAGWETLEFDDSGWPNALECRRLPHMLREVIHPTRLVGYFSVHSQGRPAEVDHEPGRQLEVDYVGASVVLRNPRGIVCPELGPAVFRDRETDGVGFVVDLGEEMLGYPFVEFECPADVTLNLGHGESLSRNRVQTVILPESGAEQRYADRYVTRSGRQRWEIYDSKGCRYLELHFRRVPKEADGALRVIIHDVGFVRSRAPVNRVTSFTCSVETLTRTFDICRRTAEVKHQDWHICDAQREQNRWIEMYQDMLYVQAFGRSELLRETIEAFARGQLPSGYIPSVIPSISPDEQTPKNQYLFSTVCFPLVVWFDWLYGGEDERQVGWLDTTKRVFDALLRYIRPDGVFGNAPGYHWAEWSGMDARPDGGGGPVKDSWAVTFYNALLVLALERSADMATAFNRADDAKSWRGAAAALRKAADSFFWSDERQAYIDGVYDGEPSLLVSQATNAVATLARLGSPERLRSALGTVLEPGKFDVESGFNNMALFHEALESLNMDACVPDRIRRIWGHMLEQGATTTWEQEMALERSNGCCFGFGAHPLNYLVRNLLGIVPIEPGYHRFSFRLAPYGVLAAQGKIATPNGYIGVSWQEADGVIKADLDVPPGTEALIASPRSMEASIKLDGEAAPLATATIATCTFLRAETRVVRVGEGLHKIVFEPAAS